MKDSNQYQNINLNRINLPSSSISNPTSRKSPKTLAIIRGSYRPDGGAEQIISRILKGIKEQFSMEVSLITKKWKTSESDDFTVLTCPKRGWFRHTKFLNFNEDVNKLLEINQFDLVQSHERIPGCQIYRAGDGVHLQWLSIRKQNASKLQQYIWDHSSYHKAIIHAEKTLFLHPKLQKIICNSTQIKLDILKHYPEMAEDKLEVIYNGIDLESFIYKDIDDQLKARADLGFQQADKLLLYVGSGFQRKGLEIAIKALSLSTEWKLIVVGKDKKSHYYQRLCQQLKIEDRVLFAGVQTNVKTYYAACDLLIHPALYDPAPNVVLEAMASGRGVIISDNCGNHDMIEQGVNGYICETGNIQSLVKLLDFINNKDQLVNMGKQARLTAEQYPITRMINELMTVYQYCLNH